MASDGRFGDLDEDDAYELGMEIGISLGDAGLGRKSEKEIDSVLNDIFGK